MYRKLTSLAALLTLLSVNLNAFAQSGRGRQPAPPPKPSPRQQREQPAALNVPEGGKLVKQEIVGATARYTLKNGLTLIVRERHAVPLAAVVTYVKAGYFDEADEVAGLAHLMEHMFFKGTPTRPLGSIATETRRLGGVLNASTFYDKTSYYTVAPAESLPKVLEIQADLLQNPTFDAEELKKESLVVIQESKRKQDNPAALALERMYATAFSSHRMKRWRIGADDVLKNSTREQLQAFYQNYYRPSNTVIVVVGDVTVRNVLGQVQQLYGNFAPADVKRAPGPEEPPQDKLRYGNERGDITQTVVTVGYHAPALAGTPEGLKEQAATEVLAAVLGTGRGARLNQALRERTGIVTSVTADYQSLPGVGMLSVQMRLDPANIDKAEAEYFREVEKFRRELISDGELQRAKSMLEKRFYDAVNAVDDEAEALAHYQAHFGDFKLLDSYVARVREVTAKDVQQAAAKYLSVTNATVHEYEPRSATPRTFTPEKFAEAVAVFAPNAAQPVRPEDLKPATALKAVKQGEERSRGTSEGVIVVEQPLPVKDFSVYRGPRSYVREDHTQPKLAVGVFFQGGRLVEDQSTSGTTELMLRAMLKSTTTRKGDLIALELESYGGEINVVNEPDFFGFTLDVLSRNAEEAVKVLLDIVENPFFDKTEVARERDGLLARQLQQRDDGLARPVELALASAYPNHPYGLPRYGLANAVKAATPEALEAWHAKTVKRQFPLVILVGDTDGSSLVSSIFSDTFKRSSDSLDEKLKVNLPALHSTPQEQAEQRSRKQTAQAVAFRTPPAAPTATGASMNYALEVMRGYASGLGGRFFNELRDKQSLAYTVTLTHQPRLASGALIAYIATLPENEAKAQEGLRAELQRLAAAPPTDAELEMGRNAVIGSYATALQSRTERLLEYARAAVFGRKPAEVESQPELIRGVKKEDIKSAAEAVIKITQAGRGVVRGEVAPPPAPTPTPAATTTTGPSATPTSQPPAPAPTRPPAKQ
jgi:zinc protease